MGSSIFPSSESQQRWLQHMEYSYLNKGEIRPCVFQLPPGLKETKPESYIPQFVGLGPHHHFRPEVQFMTTKKRDAVELSLAGLQNFEDLIHTISNDFEPTCRSCYDRYLDLDATVLSWILIVDSIFLLYFIHVYNSPSEWSNLYLHVEKLVPDVFMLENQIPFSIIRALGNQISISCYPTNAPEKVFKNFYDICSNHSPLQLAGIPEDPALAKSIVKSMLEGSSHILDFMYRMIVANYKTPEEYYRNHGFEMTIYGYIHRWDFVIPRTVKIVCQRSWETLRFVADEFKSALWKEKSANANYDIPSASRLFGILNMRYKFLYEDYGILNVEQKKGQYYDNVFYLPKLKMGPNSETIFRNLIAHEAAMSKQLESTPLRDFVNIMCGLIKSKRDVMLLREAEIFEKEPGLTDTEILNAWNGIRQCVENNSSVDKTIESVNTKFNQAKRVRSTRWLARGVANVLQYFTFLERFVGWITEFVTFFKTAILFLVALFIGYKSACGINGCDHKSGEDGELLGHILMLPRKMLPHHQPL